jgi:hypothetical protein
LPLALSYVLSLEKELNFLGVENFVVAPVQPHESMLNCKQPTGQAFRALISGGLERLELVRG